MLLFYHKDTCNSIKICLIFFFLFRSIVICLACSLCSVLNILSLRYINLLYLVSSKILPCLSYKGYLHTPNFHFAYFPHFSLYSQFTLCKAVVKLFVCFIIRNYNPVCIFKLYYILFLKSGIPSCSRRRFLRRHFPAKHEFPVLYKCCKTIAGKLHNDTVPYCEEISFMDFIVSLLTFSP